MPIPVTCPGCHKRFEVSDKFAGQKGPCPSCKTVISIPKADEQVVIHAPENLGPKGITGQAVLKPIARTEAKFSWPVTVGAIAAVLLVVLVAYLLGRFAPVVDGQRQIPWWIWTLGALAIAPGLVSAGYSFLRNQELEPYRGTALWIRIAICSVVYAGLWGGYAYLKVMLLDPGQIPEMRHLLVILPVLFVPGTLAAIATLDLDGINAGIHYAMYFVASIVLRWVMSLSMF